jgi:copper chaperone CopZ
MAMTTELKITGMNCDHCARAVKRALELVPGVSGADVSFATGLAQIQGHAHAEALVRAVVDAGYQAELLPAG